MRPDTSLPNFKQLTPVMVVEQVEPCLAFWCDRLGFTVENRVPGPDGALVFASAKCGAVEVMYQTRASVVSETPSLAGELAGHSVTLFLTVDDLDAVEQAVAGAPVVKPRHETFYGSTEIYVREPGGNIVGFAAFK
ncbi:MAG: VOC family protein [Gemmatimonadaceae bacterium]